MIKNKKKDAHTYPELLKNNRLKATLPSHKTTVVITFVKKSYALTIVKKKSVSMKIAIEVCNWNKHIIRKSARQSKQGVLNVTLKVCKKKKKETQCWVVRVRKREPRCFFHISVK